MNDYPTQPDVHTTDGPACRLIAPRTNILLPIAFAIAAGGSADAGIGYSGFARFGSVTDTIQVLGNTQFGASYGTAQADRGDFTYEMHIRIDPSSSGGHIISEQRDTWEDKTLIISGNGDYSFSSIADNTTGTIRGTISAFPAGEWMHLAYVKSGSVATIYLNGQAVANHAALFQYPDHAGSWMSIGMFRYGAGWYYPTDARPSFIGDLDWIRVSAGARYTGNFVPPSESGLSADASTQLLLRFNEAPGTAVLVDESSNGFLCNLGVPVSPGVVATAPTLMYGAVPAPGTVLLLAIGGCRSRGRR
jgi:hypothetical protein